MSFLDAYSQAQRVERYRRFLRRPKQGFRRKAGLLAPGAHRLGRPSRYDDEAVAALETAVNDFAARAEAAASFAERYTAARNYALVTDARVARIVRCSRELVRQWREGSSRPAAATLEVVAVELGVPAQWLKYGGEALLPPDCRVGVRVGAEAMYWRTMLLERMVAVGIERPMVTSRPDVEQRIREMPELAVAARRAGGRWLPEGNEWVFIAWEALAVRGLQRRDWPDAVECIIEQELGQDCSTYRAWQRVRDRCEAQALPYPSMIALQKRVQRAREQRERYGIPMDEAT